MTKYFATIKHHSISRAREIAIVGTLTAAKRAATKEFSGEFHDYNIVIYEAFDGRAPTLTASKKVASTTWRNH